ncbi:MULTISPECIES: hypothetical protein [Brevundimonas]|uniref:hypothetical protein n=1 Tax=Brevundimonas TaxID=41275 RepID=UPI0025BFBF8E|nr:MULTISPECIES: hypothetical protein [Brevundimonas]
MEVHLTARLLADASTPMDLTGRAVVLFLDRQGLPDAHHEIAGTVQTEGRVLFSVADTSDWIKGDYTLEVRLDGASVVVGRIAVAKGAAASGSDMVGAAQGTDHALGLQFRAHGCAHVTAGRQGGRWSRLQASLLCGLLQPVLRRQLLQGLSQLGFHDLGIRLLDLDDWWRRR